LIEMIRRAPGPDSLAGLVDLVDHVVRHLAITKPGQRSGVAGQDERIAVAEARPIVMQRNFWAVSDGRRITPGIKISEEMRLFLFRAKDCESFFDHSSPAMRASL
jgi:hypothetical protein